MENYYAESKEKRTSLRVELNKMTINEMNMHPAELIEHRLRQEKANRNKIASDAKGKGDSLTYPNSKADTIYSETTRAIGDYKDEKAMRSIVDDSSYYDDLMEEL